MGEEEEYDQVIKDCKASHRDFEYDKLSINYLMTVIPINFSMEHKSMLSNAKMLMEREGGFIAINSKFTKLITSLRTATEKGEFQLDKEATSYNDIFDAFRLAMRFFYFKSTEDIYRKTCRYWTV